MIAPLVPELIDEHLNLLVALLVGFGFGFVLEQAGFSSTRKLAGLFYGYDFTVLRVFFTAGLTALLGSLVLSKLGWLDLSLVYVNPTFLYAAMVGGAVMGLGFIIGGFCPGTSLVGASIGRIDAMVFVAGGLLGVFLFGEAYPWIEPLYMAEDMGGLYVYDVLGLSPESFALALTAMALAAFAATYFIERKVTGKPARLGREEQGRYLGFGLLLLLPAIAMVWVPDSRERLMAQAQDADRLETTDFAYYTSDKLAYKLLKQDSMVNLVDLRPVHAYKQGHIPLAASIPFSELQDRKYEELFSDPAKIHVLYGADEQQAKQAYYILQALGHRNLYVLQADVQQFDRTVMQPYELPERASMQDRFDHRFRSRARLELPRLEQQRQVRPEAKAKPKKKIQGGCS